MNQQGHGGCIWRVPARRSADIAVRSNMRPLKSAGKSERPRIRELLRTGMSALRPGGAPKAPTLGLDSMLAPRCSCARPLFTKLLLTLVVLATEPNTLGS